MNAVKKASVCGLHIPNLNQREMDNCCKKARISLIALFVLDEACLRVAMFVGMEECAHHIRTACWVWKTQQLSRYALRFIFHVFCECFYPSPHISEAVFFLFFAYGWLCCCEPSSSGFIPIALGRWLAMRRWKQWLFNTFCLLAAFQQT